MKCSKCNKEYALTINFNPFASPDSIISQDVCYKCNKYKKQDLINKRLSDFKEELRKQFQHSDYICLSKSKHSSYRVIVPHRLIPNALDEISFTLAVALGYKYKAPYGIKLKESPDEFIKMLNHKFDIILNDRGIY